jgi:hypothetical protein
MFDDIPSEVPSDGDLASVLDLAVLARELQLREREPDTVRHFCLLAAELLHADHVAFTAVTRGGFRVVAATSQVPVGMAKTQLALDEGPSVSAMRGAAPVRSGDLGHDERWPTFGRRAVSRTGTHSMMSPRSGGRPPRWNVRRVRREKRRFPGDGGGARHVSRQPRGCRPGARPGPGASRVPREDARAEPPHRNRDRDPHGAAWLVGEPGFRGHGVRSDLALREGQQTHTVRAPSGSGGGTYRVGPVHSSVCPVVIPVG